MKVKELIQKLKEMPPESDVWYVYDGAMRREADIVYLAQNGNVDIAEENEYIYDEAEKPIGAPPNKTEWDSYDLGQLSSKREC